MYTRAYGLYDVIMWSWHSRMVTHLKWKTSHPQTQCIPLTPEPNHDELRRLRSENYHHGVFGFNQNHLCRIRYHRILPPTHFNLCHASKEHDWTSLPWLQGDVAKWLARCGSPLITACCSLHWVMVYVLGLSKSAWVEHFMFTIHGVWGSQSITVHPFHPSLPIKLSVTTDNKWR